MHKSIFFSLLLLLTITVDAQAKKLPEEATAFLLPGYEMLDYITGDLNNDKKQDAILILKQNGEDTSYDELKRPFIILIRHTTGKLQQVKRNDDAILCRQCGGAFGDPYEGIQLAKSGFEIDFYGGSSWRWGRRYTFKYNVVRSNWYLSNQTEISYLNTEAEINPKEVNIGAIELGAIGIDSFNCNPDFTQTKWKVAAAKTYFYNNPKINSKPRKAYLIKGDAVSSYRVLKNFVEVDFENKKEKSSSGFILKKHLVKIE